VRAKLSHHFWQDPMLDRVDPFYQGRARLDGDRLLTDDGARVEAFIHVVNGDARGVHSRVQRIGDRPPARELREQGWMDVDDAIAKAIEKNRSEQVHVTGEHDEVDAAKL
jgi:hypothetical protein